MVSDGYLSSPPVVMSSPKIRSLGDGSLSSNVKARHRLMVRKDWVRVAANRSSKMRECHGSRANELRSIMRRRPDGMHGHSPRNIDRGNSRKLRQMKRIFENHKRSTARSKVNVKSFSKLSRCVSSRGTAENLNQR